MCYAFIVCSLEGKKYEDGSQTKVDCNDWLVFIRCLFHGFILLSECKIILCNDLYISVCACGSWVCSSKKCDEQLNEIDDVDEDEDLDDELDEAEDETEDKASSKDEVKILKIEEDIDLKIDDPDEDQPAKSIFDTDDDDDSDDDEDDEDDDEEIDVEPIKKSKNKKKKST